MKITKQQLRRIIKEEKQKVLRETIADSMDFENVIQNSANDIADLFYDQMERLFIEDPAAFVGRSTESEWLEMVEEARDALWTALERDIYTAVERIEASLHSGDFRN